ncbi:MAG TPA: tRNA (uridine(34)/cytosine(34)/5-carboxymethylaminomethyluridine(34)-2'-O)-methyltransferase TrmL [Firmicutes bacterium]|nr:tRNA (uridine(34)/cytosine(34)/5-carboxymethylaminomethyluridine(34)-2'-O)-methyltransferase TrmL [Bacillota bacterium]
MNIVLVEPEIPQNTGNISRTCAVTGASLHLVGKLGFSTEDRYLKRSGLDYWHMLDLHYYDSIEELYNLYPQGRFFYATTKGGHLYTQPQYRRNDFLVFGKETKGLPEDLLKANLDSCIRIPMIDEARSLNLSNSVAIVLYEALRQQNFDGLKQYGKLSAL